MTKQIAYALGVLCLFLLAEHAESEAENNEWGGSVGYAFAGLEHPGTRRTYNYSFEIFFRNYITSHAGLEVSGMFVPKQTGTHSAFLSDSNPPLEIRYDTSGYAVPVRAAIIYSPLREERAGVSFTAGVGFIFDHIEAARIDDPPPEFLALFPETDRTDELLEIDFGVSGEFLLNDNIFLIPRLTLGFGSEQLLGFRVVSVGIGRRF